MPTIFNIDYSSLDQLDPPTYREVSLDDMVIDERVQRDLLPTKLNGMVGKWSWALFAASPLVVSHRGGKYVVLDGQHRRAGAELQPLRPGTKEHTAWCLVYDGMSLQQEAMMFIGLNDATKVMAASQFNALVTAGEASAVAVNKVINYYGLTVNPSGGPRCFAAVGAALRISRWTHGLAVLGDALSVLTQAFPDPVAPNRPFREEMVTALARIIHRYGTDVTDGGVDVSDNGRLVKMFRNSWNQYNASEAILIAATQLKQGNNVSKTLNAAAVMVMEYNNSVHAKYKLPMWDPKAESRRNMTDDGEEDTDD
jgi:hypothetical protein